MSESPFKPFGNHAVLEPLQAQPEASGSDTTGANPGEERPDGRARQPWAKVLDVGSECKFLEVGQTVYFFYAEEVQIPGEKSDGRKYLIVKETDVYVALK